MMTKTISKFYEIQEQEYLHQMEILIILELHQEFFKGILKPLCWQPGFTDRGNRAGTGSFKASRKWSWKDWFILHCKENRNADLFDFHKRAGETSPPPYHPLVARLLRMLLNKPWRNQITYQISNCMDNCPTEKKRDCRSLNPSQWKNYKQTGALGTIWRQNKEIHLYSWFVRGHWDSECTRTMDCNAR